MQIADNYVIFKVDKLWEDMVKYQNNQFYFDPMFDPSRHTRCFGEVVQLPLRLKKVPMLQENVGIPRYYEQAPYFYKWVTDIEEEVQVGDKIYFHFNTIMKLKQNLIKEVKDPKNSALTTEWWLKVRYDSIICAVRYEDVPQETEPKAGEVPEKKTVIIPIGSYTLVEPDMESWDDILLPIAQVGADGKALKDVAGQTLVKPKEQWLQKKVRPEAKPLRGWVRHVGSPLKGDKLEIKVGQMIYYKPNADWVNRIEGKEYYAIRQKHILGRIEND